ncbi:hypothetical protein FHG87_004638 [Trinorchestia longiramus]|nr:hypothetical protein FHG87_004638 [Trinorchestia longiramus]
MASGFDDSALHRRAGAVMMCGGVPAVLDYTVAAVPDCPVVPVPAVLDCHIVPVPAVLAIPDCTVPTALHYTVLAVLGYTVPVVLGYAVPAVPDCTVAAVPNCTVAAVLDCTVAAVPDCTVSAVLDCTVAAVPDCTVAAVPDCTVAAVPDCTVAPVPDCTVAPVPDCTVAAVPDWGSILEGYGDVLGVFCPDFTLRSPVWHHREIIREGIRRAVVRYFQESPKEAGEFAYRYGMTLEEVYQEKYGAEASPRPFILALEDIIHAAVEADEGQNAWIPTLHFNNEQFEESQEILQLRWGQIVSALKAREVAGARHLLGLALVAIQDFYAHSNWIELGHEQILECLGLPAGCAFSVAGRNTTTCEQCPPEKQDCRRLLRGTVLRLDLLTSEYLPQAPGSASVRGKCVYPFENASDRSTPVRGGLGKDLPSVCFSNRADLHDRAARLAARATSHYMTSLRREVGDHLFRLLLSLYTKPPVVIVYGGAGDLISRATYVSDSLIHLLEELQKKHESVTSPPMEYVLVLYSNSRAYQ